MNFKKYVPNKKQKETLIKIIEKVKDNDNLTSMLLGEDVAFIDRLEEEVTTSFEDSLKGGVEFTFEILNIFVGNFVFLYEEGILDEFDKESYEIMENYYNSKLYKLFEYFNE